MLKVHAYLGDQMILDQHLEHIPRVGDTVRLDVKGGEIQARVSEVIWCWNEHSFDVQRVNVHLDEAPAGTIG
jgi:hypothetical protein